jgi:hypothetical protein
VKLFATGKGNAPKDVVLTAAIQKLQYAGNDHNEADALWLLEMAVQHYHSLPPHGEYQDRALEPISWPTLSTPTEALAHG